ncbi:hypothetical protein Golob_014712 [Gossypium lobatum]|uniref:Uncharacterized protein n=1 Tax=Gossypium lobatum TaxID=34289 RepID=A0A7J8LYX0_9ROSI|nr:hypothetical protein [Gossypium lobatum]
MLLGKGAYKQGERLQSARNDSAGEFDFLNGDFKKTMVSGIPTIELLEHIQQIMFKDVETTVVLKLLGQNIGYAALFSHISSLWHPKKSFHLMDIEIGYFLSKLHIRLLSLLGFMYKMRILEAVGGLVGKVVKLDLSTDSKNQWLFC